MFKNSTEGSNQVDTTKFEKLKSFFTKESLPFSIDSIFISKENFINDSEIKILQPYSDLIKIKEFSRKHGKLNTFIHSPYKILYFDNGFFGLIYKFSLNPEIPFDADIKKVILGIYTSKGELESEIELGLLELHPGSEKVVTSFLTDSTCVRTITEFIDQDTGMVKLEPKIERYVLSNGKIILN
jgi:hypothetical protein